MYINNIKIIIFIQKTKICDLKKRLLHFCFETASSVIKVNFLFNYYTMQFEKDHIYHIYNQGNNRQKIFFDRENYLFFLQKMNDYLLPYCDIMAWCLMPNHFHWMVYVREAELIDELIDRVIQSHSANTPSRGAI